MSELLWYSEQQIGDTRHMTPEGYLVCENVPIARIGPMLYSKDELPVVTPDNTGIITIERTEDEVFDPATLASFNCKPIVIKHPPALVNSATWKDHAVGHAINVRRGTGDKINCVVADLFVTSDEGIEAITSGRYKQISSGYVAKYETIKPGLGKQTRIRGNHIALCNNARCGEICSVGDSNDRVISLTAKGNSIMPTVAEQLTKALAAWKNKDQTTLDQVMGEMAGSSGGPPGRPGDTLPAPTDQAGGSQHRIIVNVHGGQATSPATPTASGSPTPAMGGPAVQPVDMGQGTPGATPAPAAAPTAGGGNPSSSTDPAIAQIQQQIAQILAMLNDDGENDDEEETDGENVAPNEGGSAPDRPTGDTATVTKDSSNLHSHFQDVVARAEILAPGKVTIPTFDAKVSSTATNDSLCNVMRSALRTAYDNDQTRALVQPLLGGRSIDDAVKTCDAVTPLFMAASELKKAANNSNTTKTLDVSHATNAPPTQSELNKKYASFWNK